MKFFTLLVVFFYFFSIASSQQTNTQFFTTDFPFSKCFKFTHSSSEKQLYIQYTRYSSNHDPRTGDILRCYYGFVENNPSNNFLKNQLYFCFLGTWQFVEGFVVDFERSLSDTNLLLCSYAPPECEPYLYAVQTTSNGASAQMIIPQTIWANFSSVAIDPVNDSIQYIHFFSWGENNGFWKTSDRGSSWNIINELPQSAGFIKVNPMDNSTIFAIGNPLMRSTNGGHDFHSLSFNAGNASSMEFDIQSNSIYITMEWNPGGIYRSTNNGDNWEMLFNIPTNTIDIDPVDNNILNAGTGAGIYRSTDAGANWSLYNNAFSPSKNILGLMKNSNMGDTMVVVTNDGAYKVNASIIVGIEPTASEIPENFILYQNYPNPFNPGTVISYSLKVNSDVSLKVYDALGKEVATLINGKHNAGSYSVEFSGAEFTSGIYFYRLQVDEFTETKRMVLMK